MEAEVLAYITEFLVKEYSISIDPENETYLNQHLFCLRWNLPPWALIYLLNALEQKYHVEFSVQDIDNDRLYTIRELTRTTLEKMNSRK